MWESGIQWSPSTPSIQTLDKSNLAPTSNQNRFPLDFPLNSFLYHFTLDNSTHVVSAWQVEKKVWWCPTHYIYFTFQNNRVFFVFIFKSAQFQIKCSTMSEYNQAHCSAGSRPWEKGGRWSSRPWDKGRGAPVSTIFFRPFGPQFGLKIRVSGGGMIVVVLPHPFPYFRLFASNSR